MGRPVADALTTALSRLAGDRVSRRELYLLLGAIALGLVVRVAYVLITHGHTLAGDEPEYEAQARFFSDGHLFWSTLPYGTPHPSVWKAPGYPAWVGTLYALGGENVLRVLLAQTLLGPVTIFLTWLLARRLLGAKVALAAAAIAAVYPNMWQWEARLYPEALALPLALLVFVLVLGRRPTPRLALAAGVAMGASVLVRPTSVFLFAGIAVAWSLTGGWRRGLALSALVVGVAALLVTPWTLRNYRVTDAFVPLSIQDAAAYGTFNDDAANDPIRPWAWRAYTRRDADVIKRPRSDVAFRDELEQRALDYVREHPSSLPKAFFWNGLSRTWDVRRPARALDEVPFEGRTRAVAAVGLAIYYVLLIGALVGLWRLRSRREIVLPVLALALGASIVFTVAAATRYRVPLEPLVVLLACAALPALWPGRPAAPEGRSTP